MPASNAVDQSRLTSGPPPATVALAPGHRAPETTGGTQVAKPITGRTLRLDVAILEKREGDYGDGAEVAKQSLVIPLPARSSDVAQTVTRALDFMALTTDQFRGVVVSVAAEAVVVPSDDVPF